MSSDACSAHGLVAARSRTGSGHLHIYVLMPCTVPGPFKLLKPSRLLRPLVEPSSCPFAYCLFFGAWDNLISCSLVYCLVCFISFFTADLRSHARARDTGDRTAAVIAAASSP
eukprot:6175935-Pleurochrysis_carterae.AAC.9